MDLNAWLDSKRMIVCVGSGGVGKTTTAASIGLWAALRGKKVMVLTIDPAKRLANSLGLNEFGNEETQIDLSAMPEAKGELWALMLDSRSTWDNLIARVSPNEEVRKRIMKNNIFRVMADTFAGSQDYMATEKLYDLSNEGKYDLIILDTPPVTNALDFLESPGRMISFLDEKVLGWFLSTYDRKSVWGSLMGGASTVFFRLLGAIFGSDFLDDLTELMKDFKDLYDGFRERQQETLALFRDKNSAFVTVCAPTESSAQVAEFFQEELARRELPRGGVIVNQVHYCEASEHNARSVLGPYTDKLSEDLSPRTVASVMARLGMAHRRLHELATAEKALMAGVIESAKGADFYQESPRLEDDVNDLPGLAEVGGNVFGKPARAMG